MNSDGEGAPACMVCDSAPAGRFYDRDFRHVCRDCAWHCAKALDVLIHTPGICAPPPQPRPLKPS